MKHRCILSIGSNYEAEANMSSARTCLRGLYDDIRFSRPLVTTAIGNNVNNRFMNQTACFACNEELNVVHNRLKEIERIVGRLFHDKMEGIVRIDIDLVLFDSVVLKPDDWERDYFQQGLKWLGIDLSV